MGPHLTNVGLYAAVVVLLYGCFLRLAAGHSAGALGAFAAAVLFAVHPLHSEVVNNISFREDLLVPFFLVLAWWARLRRPVGVGRGWGVPIFCGLMYLMALFSKESALVFPALLLLSDGLEGRWRGGWRAAWREGGRLYAVLLAGLLFFSSSGFTRWRTGGRVGVPRPGRRRCC